MEFSHPLETSDQISSVQKRNLLILQCYLIKILRCQIYIKNKWILTDLLTILFSVRVKETMLRVWLNSLICQL